MRPPFLFLASISGEVPIDLRDYGLIALAVVGVFVVLLTLIGFAAAIWALRRNPPIEREIDERIALSVEKAKSELREEYLRLNQERRVTMAGLFEKLENYRKETKDDYGQLRESIGKSFQDLQYTIGKLEGQRSASN